MSEQRYVVGFLFDEDERTVVLLRKNRPAWQAGKLNGMGGHVEPGESFDDAMVRECQEESGLTLLQGWTRFAELRGHGMRMGCYRSSERDAAQQVGAANDVGERFELHSVQAVMSASVETIPNLRWLVPMAMSTSGWHWPYQIAECPRTGSGDNGE